MIKDLYLIQVIVNAIVINLAEYLDYSSCKCGKKLVDPLVEECTETRSKISQHNRRKGK